MGENKIAAVDPAFDSAVEQTWARIPGEFPKEDYSPFDTAVPVTCVLVWLHISLRKVKSCLL
jgi:hypothetical protein